MGFASLQPILQDFWDSYFAEARLRHRADCVKPLIERYDRWYSDEDSILAGYWEGKKKNDHQANEEDQRIRQVVGYAWLIIVTSN